MASKILATLLAVAVLSVGGYTYWQYADGRCCGTNAKAPATPAATNTPADCDVPPCCQEPSRTSCFTLPAGEGCCEDVVPTATPTPEVVSIMPHEVK